ncbi:hypothetical protein [Snodgrassella sp. CFCC 13594]|uniref:hypothetical protein n=1 Tax=Snodgrassella sp. CFCC 13594 TaxID=1775559 RepID=UPI00083118F6|nr:hypothetical protein [Snodgrassella sp. CFCC 13594]
MITDTHKTVETHKVGPSWLPTINDFPHYRLVPSSTETGKKYCLFFYVSHEGYLILDNGVQRYQAIRHLQRLLETACFPIYEIREG